MARENWVLDSVIGAEEAEEIVPGIFSAILTRVKLRQLLVAQAFHTAGAFAEWLDDMAGDAMEHG